MLCVDLLRQTKEAYVLTVRRLPLSDVDVDRACVLNVCSTTTLANAVHAIASLTVTTAVHQRVKMSRFIDPCIYSGTPCQQRR